MGLQLVALLPATYFLGRWLLPVVLVRLLSAGLTAGTFPLWDILFGTFRMPENRLPESYGVDDQEIPTEIGGQLAYPFVTKS